MNTISLAIRNLTRQKKRSMLLCGAIAFGFCIVTIIDSISVGAINNMSIQFSHLFGAHIMVERIEKDKNDKQLTKARDEDFLKKVLTESGIEYTYISKRSSLYGTLIFEGKKVSSLIFGCDLKNEKFLFDSLDLKSGSWDNMNIYNALILNESIAEELGIESGETILIQTETVSGQANFGEFYVAAITYDTSIVGSIALYANIAYINQLTELAPDEFSVFNIMLKNHKSQDKASLILEDTFRKYVSVTSRLDAIKKNPNNIANEIRKQIKDTEWEHELYSVTSLNDYMPQLKQIMGVTQSVSTGILVVLFLIVMIGISNTFKMIIYERIREIGTMRAVGMTRTNTLYLFIWEAIFLAILGVIIGFILAVILMNILSLFTFNSQQLSFFLNNGHWTYILSPFSIIVKLIIIIILTVFAVFGSARTAAKMSPADALRSI